MITTATRQWVERKKYSFEALTAMSMLEPAEKNVICILKHVKRLILNLIVMVLCILIPSSPILL